MSVEPAPYENLYFEAIERVKHALNTLKKHDKEACVMASVATLGHGGRPSIHLVEVATIIDQGIVFLIYEGSEAHRNMARVPQLALSIAKTHSQSSIVMEGKTRRVTDEEAEVIWFRRSDIHQQNFRPKDNQALILAPERIIFRSHDDNSGAGVQVYDKQADGRWLLEGTAMEQVA